MSKLQLPTVTLMMMESQPGHHQLAKMAVDDCLAVADFGEVLILADQFNELRVPGARYARVENWPNKNGYANALWYQMPLLIKTDYVLIIQWDSWITHPELWRPEFLQYDTIGAPWVNQLPFNGLTVGNSGFSLRSKRLMDFLIKHQDKYPLTDVPWEDHMLCRVYRRQLEQEGFVWPSEELAFKFSVEGVVPDYHNSFGFHGIFNWPFYLEKERLIERAKLAAKSKYICTATFAEGYKMLDLLVNHAPWLYYFIERAA